MGGSINKSFRNLDCRSVIEKKLYKKNYNEDLKKDGIEVIENNQDEIYNAVTEILFNETKDKINNDEEFEVLEKFKIFYKEHFKLDNINLNVSQYFLKNNKDLFFV